MPSSISLKRIVCIGQEASMRRAEVDLDFPTRSQQRHLVIVGNDRDTHALYGYRSEELRFIPMSPSQHQLSFLKSRGHAEISLEDATTWLRRQ